MASNQQFTPETITKSHNPTGLPIGDGNFSQETRSRTLKRFNRLTRHLVKIASEDSEAAPNIKIAAYKAIGEYAIKPIIAELNAIRAVKNQAVKNQSSTTVSIALTGLPVNTHVSIASTIDKQHYVPNDGSSSEKVIDIPGPPPPGEAAENGLPASTDVYAQRDFSAVTIPVHPVKTDAQIRKDVQEAIEKEMFDEKGRPFKLTKQGIRKMLPLIEDGVRKCWECRKAIASITGNACICKTCKFKLDKLRKERYLAAKSS